VLSKGKKFLLLIRHPPFYSYGRRKEVIFTVNHGKANIIFFQTDVSTQNDGIGHATSLKNSICVLISSYSKIVVQRVYQMLPHKNYKVNVMVVSIKQ